MAVQSLGRVSILLKGAYSADKQYARLDIVEYEGSSYCALDDTKGNLPTNDNYWQRIAKKGEKGDTGDVGPIGETGATGNGIAAIEKISTEGAVDSYRITYTNGEYFDFDITNGDGSDWSDLRNKPFESISEAFFYSFGNELRLSEAVQAQLSSVANKLDKPATATDGQVLKYNANSGKWEPGDDVAGIIKSVSEDFEIEDGKLELSEGAIAKMSVQFTTAEWEALTPAEKAKYDGMIIDFTDDYESNICSSVQACVESENENDVAGASAVSELNNKLELKGGALSTAIQFYNNRIILFVYTNAEKTEGRRIDFNPNDRRIYIQDVSGSTTYCTFQAI